jgi:hypothetical protein
MFMKLRLIGNCFLDPRYDIHVSMLAHPFQDIFDSVDILPSDILPSESASNHASGAAVMMRG